jgi:DNA-binding response OmpR family regulator
MEQSKNILFVEDDPDTLVAWVEVLKRAGYRVVGASSFEEGRRRLKGPVDMLITDVRLGEYNGLQLVIHARTLHPDLPIMVLTAHDDVVLRSEAARFKAVFMLKPLAVDDTLARIATMLRPATMH